VLDLESRQPAAFDEDDVRLLSILAGHLAAVVENSRLVEGLEATVRARTAEIRTEQEKSETILRHVGDAILMAGLDGRIRFTNPAFSVLAGYTAGEVVGKDPHSALGGRMTERERQLYQAALAAGEMWKGEIDAQRKDGLVYQVALTVAPVRDAEGGVTGWVYSIRDISRRKGLERARRRFMTNVSHELRTPVANMKLYAQLLRRGDAPQKSERYLEVLVDQADRLAHLIADILELAALDGGQAVTAWRPIALPSLIGDAIVGHQARAEAAGVSLEASPLAGEQPAIMGDRVRLGQALGEVVENAITFSPSGGRVTLAAELIEQGGRLWVRIDVRDTGPGIPAAERERIFDRFFRGSLAESGHVPGTGLGLSIAQDILRAHGGRLTVESDPAAGAADEAGAGSIFALWLRAGPLPGEQVDQPPERVDTARVDELPPTE
jgi:PAS domain S-box-containing protein